MRSIERVANTRLRVQAHHLVDCGNEVLRCDGALVLVEIRGATDAKGVDEWLLGENLWKPKQIHPRGLQTRAFGHALFDLYYARAVYDFAHAAKLGTEWKP